MSAPRRATRSSPRLSSRTGRSSGTRSPSSAGSRRSRRTPSRAASDEFREDRRSTGHTFTREEEPRMPQKIVPNLWFDTEAEEAAAFYISIFEDGRVLNTTRYNAAGPGEEGRIMTVEWEVR